MVGFEAVIEVFGLPMLGMGLRQSAGIANARRIADTTTRTIVIFYTTAG